MRKGKSPKKELSTESPKKTTWVDLLGFDKDRARLRDLLSEERLPTVILFEGKEGIAKSSLLFFLAALHFCSREDACGVCNSCQLIAANQHPDVLVIRGNGDSLKVSSISDISEFISFAPQTAAKHARRLVLIIDAEDLTTQAVNKLLKTLEEPSSSSRIFISTAKIRHLLPTLLSRCIHWRLRPPTPHDVEKIVRRNFADQQDLPNKEELAEISQRFGNAPGKILHFLEKREVHNEAIELLHCRSIGELLTLAENFKAQVDTRLFDFIQEFEYALNKLYREAAMTRDLSRTGNIRERRVFLSELKLLLNKQKIALNPQLVIERLGLCNFQTSRSDARV